MKREARRLVAYSCWSITTCTQRNVLSTRSTGTVRVLAYHAAELFLKPYMRSAGETVARLQAHELPQQVRIADGIGIG